LLKIAHKGRLLRALALCCCAFLIFCSAYAGLNILNKNGVKVPTVFGATGDMGVSLGANGTSANPFILTTKEDFVTMRTNINNDSTYLLSGSNRYYYDAYYRLNADIDLGSWSPISKFYGDLDGQNHILTYSLSTSNANTSLFQVLGRNSTSQGGLKSANIHDIALSPTLTQFQSGITQAGGLCAEVYGNVTLSNVHTIGGAVNAYNSNGSRLFLGAIAGYVNAEQFIATNCSNQGTEVTGSAITGGLFGYVATATNSITPARLSNCFVITPKLEASWTATADGYGHTIGGLIGRAQRAVTIENCFVDANPTGTAQSSANCPTIVGGLIGECFNSEQTALSFSITTSFFNGTMTANATGANIAYAGGLIGRIGANNLNVQINNSIIIPVPLNTNQGISIDAPSGQAFFGYACTADLTATVILNNVKYSAVGVFSSTAPLGSPSTFAMYPNDYNSQPKVTQEELLTYDFWQGVGDDITHTEGFFGWNNFRDNFGIDEEGALFIKTFTPRTYTIYFLVSKPSSAPSSSGSMASMVVPYGQSVRLNLNQFTVPQYRFLGWTKTLGGSVVYTDGQVVKNLVAPTSADSSINLRAVWEKLSTANVGFFDADGTTRLGWATDDTNLQEESQDNRIAIETGNPAMFYGTEPTRAHTVFNGWRIRNESANNLYRVNQSGRLYNVSNNALLNVTPFGGANMDFIAEYKWYINYDSAYPIGATGTLSGTMNRVEITYRPVAVFSLDANAYTIGGRSFDGWAVILGGARTFVNTQTISANLPDLNPEYFITNDAPADMTLYARWTPIKYNIAFNANGGQNGTGTSSMTNVEYDSSVNLSINGFVQTDYAFAGWTTFEYKDLSYDDITKLDQSIKSKNFFSDGQSVTNLTDSVGTVTLYAVWVWLDPGNPNSIVIIQPTPAFEWFKGDGSGQTLTQGTIANSLTFVRIKSGVLQNAITGYAIDAVEIAITINGALYQTILKQTPISSTYDIYLTQDFSMNADIVPGDKANLLTGTIGIAILTYANYGMTGIYPQKQGMVSSFTVNVSTASPTIYSISFYNNGEEITNSPFIYARVNYSPPAGVTAHATPFQLDGGAWTAGIKVGDEWLLQITTVGAHAIAVRDALGNIATQTIEWKSYTVMYYKNQPQNASSTVSDNGTPMTNGVRYQGGLQTVPLCSYSLTGWRFLGWMVDGYATTITDGQTLVIDDSYTQNGYIYFRAKWEPIEYTVNYNGNKPANASSPVIDNGQSSSNHAYDTKHPLSTNAYSLVGWNFLGWGTYLGTTIVVYQDGALLQDKNGKAINLPDGTTLYAVWAQNTYKVTYYYAGYSPTDVTDTSQKDDDRTFKYDDPKVQLETHPSRTSAKYRFIGWTTNPAKAGIGGVVEYGIEDLVNNLTALQYIAGHYEYPPEYSEGIWVDDVGLIKFYAVWETYGDMDALRALYNSIINYAPAYTAENYDCYYFPQFYGRLQDAHALLFVGAFPDTSTIKTDPSEQDVLDANDKYDKLLTARNRLLYTYELSTIYKTWIVDDGFCYTTATFNSLKTALNNAGIILDSVKTNVSNKYTDANISTACDMITNALARLAPNRDNLIALYNRVENYVDSQFQTQGWADFVDNRAIANDIIANRVTLTIENFRAFYSAFHALRVEHSQADILIAKFHDENPDDYFRGFDELTDAITDLDTSIQNMDTVFLSLEDYQEKLARATTAYSALMPFNRDTLVKLVAEYTNEKKHYTHKSWLEFLPELKKAQNVLDENPNEDDLTMEEWKSVILELALAHDTILVKRVPLPKWLLFAIIGGVVAGIIIIAIIIYIFVRIHHNKLLKRAEARERNDELRNAKRLALEKLEQAEKSLTASANEVKYVKKAPADQSARTKAMMALGDTKSKIGEAKDEVQHYLEVKHKGEEDK